VIKQAGQLDEPSQVVAVQDCAAGPQVVPKWRP
jgi:hypothetical protein